MTPFYALKNAVNHKGKVCTPWEVRRELANYLQQFPVVPKNTQGKVIDWNDLYTRDEWFAQVNKKKKKPRRRKGEADPVKHIYTTVSQEQLELREHNPNLDETHVTDLDWIDAIARRQRNEIEADAYHGEW